MVAEKNITQVSSLKYIRITAAVLIGLVIMLTGCRSSKVKKTDIVPASREEPGKQNAVKCVCHSEDQALRSMHQVLGMRDCMQCHSENENLMAKGSEKTDEQKAATQDRKRSDPVCLECHQAGGKEEVNRSQVSGNWFCPKCQKQYRVAEAVKNENVYYCPVDGTKLLDIDTLIRQSSQKPRNGLCIACHPVDQSLKAKHTKVLTTSGQKIDNCLLCHQSHSKCGNCHF